MIDSSTGLLPLLQLWWVFLLAVIVLFFRTPFGKGLIGEVFVNMMLYLGLDKDKYKAIKDVTLSIEDGTTQIDHIVISRFGIFVIETKNMKGWIFGSENQRFWTQNIYGQKHSFQNPLHQNYKHIKALEKLFDIDGNKIFSVVVFVGDATFKTDMPDNVVYTGGLLGYINSKKEGVLSDLDINFIVHDIEAGRLSRGIKTRREHVGHVKDIVKTSSVLICPRCNSGLVLRTAKKGSNAGNEFYGCKNYPRCKYTRNK